MGRDYPNVYRYSAEDARRSDELKQHARSLQQNASCACAIESSIRDYLTEDGLKEGCAGAVLLLPDWARKKLEELHAPKQDGPSMGGMV